MVVINTSGSYDIPLLFDSGIGISAIKAKMLFPTGVTLTA